MIGLRMAVSMMDLNTLGDDWLTPELFRFGASSLLSGVELQIAKAKAIDGGRYQSAEYFSLG